MPRKKRKPIEEMHDRELAEHIFGKELVEKLHEEFDLRDTSKSDNDDFTPRR
jgi:hypothetical protein